MRRAITFRVATVAAMSAVLVAGLAGVASAKVTKWTTAPSLLTATSGAASVTLGASAAFPDGGILVAGGLASGGALKSVELYNPVTAAWTATTQMNAARADFTLTLLNNGEVLAVGGYSGNSHTSLSTAEIFNPNVSPPTWTLVGSLPRAVYDQTATLLSDGTVLVAGGYTIPCTGSCTNFVSGAAEVFDPNAADPGYNVWTPVGQLNDPRYGATATALGNGTVLVAGGIDQTNSATDTAEIYSYTPVTSTTLPSGSFAYNTATSGSSTLNVARAFQTATTLSGGDVLLVGGQDGNGNSLASAELYAPATSSFALTGSLATARDGSTATLLGNGDVLAEGGEDLVAGSGGALHSAELYDPGTGTWTAAGFGGTRLGAVAALLGNGWVLVGGGSSSPGGSSVTSAEFYRPPVQLSLSSSSGLPGTTITVSGSGFGIGETVNITFQGSTIGSPTTSGTGTFSTMVTIPSTAKKAISSVIATGATSSLARAVKFTVL